ncbi:serine/threonine-protein kinase [Pseudonocardia acidicola]|uniref:non-specific serine/threonine protein kinase n=1 Tax=Pseudonocardia acidicola TaxID=2724939 RepID=A0ABX1SGA8_9PSEU|nr:serine/threonine-protein kinase [Pseudonocardia acidicola]NMI00596.1 serine/threonine protein kinase [Pseudonocardia acidicola]
MAYGPRNGRFDIGEAIGSGGYGTVYRAIDDVLGRTVALKCVQATPGLSSDEADAIMGRARREAKALAAVAHPHIATLYDSFDDESGRLWLVMQFVEGESLATTLARDTRIPIDRVAEIGGQLADALAEVHAQKIVHRDVKPANVILGAGASADLGDDNAVLVDFGISRREGETSLTPAHSLVGTRGYLAPELASGQTGPPADVFALGVTLYLACEGVLPFDVATVAAQIRAADAGDFRRPKRAGGLTDVLVGMLSPDPAARPSAAELARSLPRQVGAHRTGPPPATNRAGRSARLPVYTGSTAVLAALVTGIGVLALFSGDDRTVSPHPQATATAAAPPGAPLRDGPAPAPASPGPQAAPAAGPPPAPAPTPGPAAAPAHGPAPTAAPGPAATPGPAPAADGVNARWAAHWASTPYHPFALFRAVYNTSTVDERFPFGMLVFAVRLVVALVVLVPDVLFSTVVFAGGIAFALFGETGRTAVYAISALPVLVVLLRFTGWLRAVTGL